MVRDEYNDLYESDVNAVHVVYQSKDLDPLVDEYNGLVRKLEDLIDDYASKMQSGKRIKRKTVSSQPLLSFSCLTLVPPKKLHKQITDI